MSNLLNLAAILLEKELVGEDKEYFNEEELYIKDYKNNQLLYKPEVFERYVEIYNELIDIPEYEGTEYNPITQTME